MRTRSAFVAMAMKIADPPIVSIWKEGNVEDRQPDVDHGQQKHATQDLQHVSATTEHADPADDGGYDRAGQGTGSLLEVIAICQEASR